VNSYVQVGVWVVNVARVLDVVVDQRRVGGGAHGRPVRSFSGSATAVPWVIDGGARSSAPVPQADGVEPMAKSSVAPSASSECGSAVEGVRLAVDLQRLDVDVLGAVVRRVMTIFLPFSRFTVALVNSGEPIAYSGLPICSG